MTTICAWHVPFGENLRFSCNYEKFCVNLRNSTLFTERMNIRRYISFSPYILCVGNPVKFVGPDGEDV